MDAPTENLNINVTPSSASAAKHNLAENVEVSLESEEKDEFIEIKVCPKVIILEIVNYLSRWKIFPEKIEYNY